MIVDGLVGIGPTGGTSRAEHACDLNDIPFGVVLIFRHSSQCIGYPGDEVVGVARIGEGLHLSFAEGVGIGQRIAIGAVCDPPYVTAFMGHIRADHFASGIKSVGKEVGGVIGISLLDDPAIGVVLIEDFTRGLYESAVGL